VASSPLNPSRLPENSRGREQELMRVAPKHVVAHLQRPWLAGEEIESVRPLFKVDGSWAKALEDKEISAWMEV